MRASPPEEIPGVRKVLHLYWKKAKYAPGGILPYIDREKLVKDLIDEYSHTPEPLRGNVLVPASPHYLNPKAVSQVLMGKDKDYIYKILYNWPANNGFLGDYKKVILKPGDLMDRLGSPSLGRFAAPVHDPSKPYPFLSRALPYYFDYDNIVSHPAYHLYMVMQPFVVATSSLRGCVYKGTTAPAFRTSPPDGGGVQYLLPAYVSILLEKEFIKEVF